jgi:hypothetical protein
MTAKAGAKAPALLLTGAAIFGILEKSAKKFQEVTCLQTAMKIGLSATGQRTAQPVITDDRRLAQRLLEEGIARYHAKKTNREIAKKAAQLLPGSFYVHLIDALYHVESRLLGSEKMAYFAYQSLAMAKELAEKSGLSDRESFERVERILHHETEVVPVPYEY